MRIRLDIRYDGGPFHGWARQPGLPTVQGALETALSVVFREPIVLTVAGRTDAGVHATGQVAHFDISAERLETVSSLHSRRRSKVEPSPDCVAEGGARWNRPQDRVAEDSWDPFLKRLESVLHLVLSGNTPDIPGLELGERVAYPPEALDAIVVSAAREVPDVFDARFSALSRHYVYRIVDVTSTHNPLTRGSCWWYTSALDLPAMQQAAGVLLGEHDFAAFCKPREGATTIRTLQELEITRESLEDEPRPGNAICPEERNVCGDEESIPTGEIVFRLKADAFCHSMVRSLVGALTEIGRRRRDVAWLKSALESRQRIPEIPLAPAQGLTLVRVDYPETEAELAARQTQTRQTRSL